jgi:Gametolysin peptidase M11/NPCBM-associated, NEW3 domain of alpha-galactosidase
MHVPVTRRYSRSRAFRSGLGATLLTAFAIALATHPVHSQGQRPRGETELDGTLEVQYEDYDGGARLRHFLKTPTGRLELTFPGEPPDLLTGSRVRVRGTERSDGTLMLSSSGSSVQTLSNAVPNTFGVQQTLVILINFQDNATQPYTVASAQNTTFTQTSNYYRENTYQQTSLAGTVVGWYTIPATSTTCANSTWAGLADQAAIDDGIDISTYSRRIYAFPHTNACGWWGLGSVGGNPSHAWINGNYQFQVVGHELGHNFGDWHSHSLSCNATGCATSEYGDDRDIMGSSRAGHMNAFQKERLGWLNYGASPSIQTVATSNNYWIEPLETATNGGPKALKILKGIDSFGYRSWYYVEARVSIGADSGVAPGVVVHTGDERTGNSSYETDLAPTTDAWVSALDANQSFTDPQLGLTITTITSDNSGALVQVAFGANLCSRTGPTVSVSPSAQSVQPGGTVSYTVSVTNNDSPGCAAAPFNLSATAPTGWSASFAPVSLSSLAPGATANPALSVTSPATASGPASIAISAGESGSLATSAGISVGVSLAGSPLNVSVTTNNSSYTTNSTVAVMASVSSGKSASSGANATFTITNPSGSVSTMIATTGANGIASVSYVVSGKRRQGTYQVQVRATAGSASGTGTTSFVE